MALSVTGLSGPQLTKLRVAIDQVREGKHPAADSDQKVVDAEVLEHLNNLHLASNAQKKAPASTKSRDDAARADLNLQ